MKIEMFQNEMSKRSYVWDKLTKRYDWAGGVADVPVKVAGPSTTQMGALASESDIAEIQTVMGSIASQKEATGTVVFNERDLTRHGYSEQTYLDTLMDQVPDISKALVEQIEAGLIRGGGVLSYATANGAVGGTISVANPEYFQIGQKVEIVDNDSAAVSGYIRTMDINTGALTIYNARTGGAVVDLSAFTTAQSAKLRLVGAGTESFLDFKTALLPSALGGSDTLYGLNKVNTGPALQAFRQDGTAFTAATILKDLLKTYFKNRKLGRGEANELLVSMGLFANAAAGLESQRQFFVKDKQAGYGFNKITLVGSEGEVTITGLNSITDDMALLMDWSALTFRGMPLKKNLYGEAGLEYYTVRATNGVKFISDLVLAGDFVINPAKLGIIYGIPSAVSL